MDYEQILNEFTKEAAIRDMNSFNNFYIGWINASILAEDNCISLFDSAKAYNKVIEKYTQSEQYRTAPH